MNDINATLSTLTALHGAATEGEWVPLPDGTIVAHYQNPEGKKYCETVVSDDDPIASDDAAFIAAAHNHWPEIAEEIGELRRNNEFLAKIIVEVFDGIESAQVLKSGRVRLDVRLSRETCGLIDHIGYAYVNAKTKEQEAANV